MLAISSATSFLVAVTAILPVPARAGAASSSPVRILATFHGDLARDGYAPGDKEINPSDAGRLAVEWAYPALHVISDQPAVVNGVAYWGDWGGTEHATSVTGRNLWSTNLGTTTDPECGEDDSAGVASSATVGTVGRDGTKERVWTGAGNGTVVSLVAATGAIVWRTRVAPSDGGFVWSSPALYDGSIYIGVSSYGDCPLVRSRIVRLDALTGKILGSFYTVPAGCLGAGVWSSPAIDAATNSLFESTGNADCTDPLQNAMLELDATTMTLVHSWQIPPASWNGDSDWGSTPTLFSARVNGHAVALVGSADKNGIFYALPRSNISRGPVWEYRVAESGTCPQCGEGSIAPAAFDGATLFVAGGSTTIGGRSCPGSLQALDPATGVPIWEDCLNAGPVLGPVTEVPGLLFVTAGAAVIGINARHGTLAFFSADPSGQPFYAGSVVAGARLYAGNTDGMLFAYGLRT